MHDNLLDVLYTAFAKHDNIGILSPQLVLPDGKIQDFSYGSFPRLTNTIIGKFAKKDETNQELIMTDWVSGAALAIRKNIFNKLNGFDEKFFLYFEDIDLCRRVSELGYYSAVLPNIKLIHYGGVSSSNLWNKKKEYYRSQSYYFYKHQTIASWAMILILRTPILLVNYFKSFIK